MLLRCTLLGTILAGCGGAPGPVWTELADTALAPERSGEVGPDERFELREVEGVTRLVARIPRDAFERDEGGGWRARQPALTIGRPDLVDDAYVVSFPGAPGSVKRSLVELGVVHVDLGGAEPPGDAELSVHARHQTVESDGRWLVSGRRVGGRGFAVWPGQRVSVRCDVPPASALRFACVKESALLGPGARRLEQVFRVRLQGEVVFEETSGAGFESVTWHEVPLPPAGVRDATIAFEVEGSFAYTSFLDPVLGPAEVGTYANRPWTRERRDVVVFLADTFRADNLAFYGGTDGRTPHLDAFVAETLAFRNAWSVSTHTLGAHTSLFSGWYPRQGGLVDFYNNLPGAIDTLAEMFARRGYRTVALTDGIVVSQAHGMEQGFAWFDERRAGLDATLARARAALEADDGRPLLLFVQTYATHGPYRVRHATREALGERFSSEHGFDHWFGQLERDPERSEGTQLIDVSRPGTRAAAAELAQLYAASAFDLDLAFASFRDLLGTHELLEHGTLVFTSDHGEAFGEHERILHAGATFDEVLRVPLLITGAGIEPGVVTRPVSLIDMPPTLAELAGLPPLPGWVGSSLLSNEGARKVFAFQSRREDIDSTLAIIDGQRKLIGYEDRENAVVERWWRAYDLARDPRELEDLLGSDAEWPRAMAAEAAILFPPLLTPRVAPERTSLSADELRKLGAMGYVETSGK